MEHIVIGASNEHHPEYYSVYAKTVDGKEVAVDKVPKATADYSLIEFRLNQLVGRILTQADASFSDPVQRKAFKDEIRQKFAEEFGFFTEHLNRAFLKRELAFIENMSDEEFDQWCKDNPPVGIEEVVGKGL